MGQETSAVGGGRVKPIRRAAVTRPRRVTGNPRSMASGKQSQPKFESISLQQLSRAETSAPARIKLIRLARSRPAATLYSRSNLLLREQVFIAISIIGLNFMTGQFVPVLCGNMLRCTTLVP